MEAETEAASIAMLAEEPELFTAADRAGMNIDRRADVPAATRSVVSVDREAGAFLYDEDRLVEVGDRVVLAYDDDPGTTKTIVLTDNVQDDPKMGIIYAGRPIGKALVSQAEGEIVELPAGDTVREAVILKIERSRDSVTESTVGTSGYSGIRDASPGLFG